MHRHYRQLLLLPLLALALLIAACGSTPHSKTTPPPTTAPASVAIPNCDPAPGAGVMGACLTPAPPGAAPPRFAAGARLIPDVSEFQGCALHSEAIVRVYEAGTEREDTRAACHLAELKRLHAWGSAYAFLRAGHGGCRFQADRTVSIVKRLGGVIGPIVADAEIGLRGGFVRCFLNRVKQDHYEAVEYTCPGCGDEQIKPIWIARYPTRPPGRWVAHQFSDRFNCRGVVGDCSINEGILSILSTKAPTPAERKARRVREARHLHSLYAERTRIRRHLLNGGCRVKRPRSACKPLFKRGSAVNREIRVLRGRGIR